MSDGNEGLNVERLRMRQKRGVIPRRVWNWAVDLWKTLQVFPADDAISVERKPGVGTFVGLRAGLAGGPLAGGGGGSRYIPPFWISVTGDKMIVHPGCAGGAELSVEADGIAVTIEGNSLISLGETTLTESIWVGIRANIYASGVSTDGNAMPGGASDPGFGSYGHGRWSNFAIVTTPLGTPFEDDNTTCHKIIGKVIKDGSVYTPEQILRSDYDFPLVGWAKDFLSDDLDNMLTKDTRNLIFADPPEFAAGVMSADGDNMLAQGTDFLIHADPATFSTAMVSTDPLANALITSAGDSLLAVDKAASQAASTATDVAGLKADLNDLITKLKNADLMQT